MKCLAVCFKQRGCSMQIFNSPALHVDHEKVLKNCKAKKRKKRNVEVLLQLRKKLIRIVYGCRYPVASDKWADCSTVLIMRAVIESAKFEKKKSKKRHNAARQKGKNKWKKKCYYSFETNSSGRRLCIVAGVQWHHTNDLSWLWYCHQKCKFEKKNKKKIIQRRKAKR